MNYQFHELEEMIENIDHKVDMFWHQRLLRKHKNVTQFKKTLLLCLGYYHEKTCDEIIDQLQEKNILEKYLETV